jgi:hypothetical protein
MSYSFRRHRGPRRLTGAAARVRVQVFPLEADRGRLTHFCNRWFNADVPPEVAWVRPAFPLVLCTVLTYPDMSEEERLESGIHSQNELYFLVPLDVMRREGRRDVFVERGVTTPFIFVDNADSAQVGFERYGFPKELCRFDYGEVISQVPWAADAQPYLSLQLEEAAEDYARSIDLVRIFRNVLGDEPGFDDATGRLVPGVAVGPSRSDLIWWLQAFLQEVGSASALEPPIAWGAGARAVLDTLRGDLPVTCFNVRQLPDPRDLTKAIYRDVVRYPLRLRRIQNVRFFAEDRAAPAAFSILIQRRDLYPIVSRLGLRVIARERRGSGEDAEVYDVIQPVSPLYLQADLTVDEPASLAWQRRRGEWITRAGTFTDESADGRPDFDGYLGGVGVLARGRVKAGIRDIKYMYFAVSRAATQAYVDERLPLRCPLKLRVVGEGAHTVLRVTLARTRPIELVVGAPLNWQAGWQMSFSVPVRVEYGGETHEVLFRLAELTESTLSFLLFSRMNGSVTHNVQFDEPWWSWTSSTQKVQQAVAVHLPLPIHRSGELRVARMPWLDVLVQSEPTPDQFPELREPLCRRLSTYTPNLYLGSIPPPDTSERWVHQRLVMTRPTGVTERPLSAVHGQQSIYMRLTHLGRLDLVSALDPVKVEADTIRPSVTAALDEAGAKILRAIAAYESAEQPISSEPTVLWQEFIDD